MKSWFALTASSVWQTRQATPLTQHDATQQASPQ